MADTNWQPQWCESAPSRDRSSRNRIICVLTATCCKSKMTTALLMPLPPFTSLLAVSNRSRSWAISGTTGQTCLCPIRRRGRPPKSGLTNGPRRRTMSAAARRRISAAMKARWAERKRGSKPAAIQKPATKKAGSRPQMSAPSPRTRWCSYCKRNGHHLCSGTRRVNHSRTVPCDCPCEIGTTRTGGWR